MPLIRQLQQHFPKHLQSPLKRFAQQMGWVKRVSFFEAADDYPMAVIIQSVLTHQLLTTTPEELMVTEALTPKAIEQALPHVAVTNQGLDQPLPQQQEEDDDDLAFLFSKSSDDFSQPAKSPLQVLKALIDRSEKTAVADPLPKSAVMAIDTLKTAPLPEALPCNQVLFAPYQPAQVTSAKAVQVVDTLVASLLPSSLQQQVASQVRVTSYKPQTLASFQVVPLATVHIKAHRGRLVAVSLKPYSSVCLASYSVAVPNSFVQVAQSSVLPLTVIQKSSVSSALKPQVVSLLSQCQQQQLSLPNSALSQVASPSKHNILPLLPPQPSKPVDAIEMTMLALPVLPVSSEEFFMPLESQVFNPKPELVNFHHNDAEKGSFDIGLEDDQEDWFEALPLPLPSRKKIANHLTTLQTDAQFEGLGFKIAYNIGYVGRYQLLLVQQGAQLSLLADDGLEGVFLKHFDENPMPKGSAKIHVSSPSKLGRKQLLTIQVGQWQGVVCVDDLGAISLQTEVALV